MFIWLIILKSKKWIFIFFIFNQILQLLYIKVINEYERGLFNIYNSPSKDALGHYVMKTDIGHFDASQNFEEMGTEFTLSLRFYENIDILPFKNSQGPFN